MALHPEDLGGEDPMLILPAGDLSAEEMQAFFGLSLHHTRTLALAKAQEYRVRIAKLERCIRKLGSVYNSAAPIHVALFTELLCQIVRSLHARERGAKRFMNICRYWRSFFRQTPNFWVDMLECTSSHPIDDAVHPCYLPTLGKRCASRPLKESTAYQLFQGVDAIRLVFEDTLASLAAHATGSE
ncbi:hypothetical protein OH77DRAFT_1316738 [Trametes cingulata]|nr:hypothetical protein OH77DRAFT_1316738 [Trametes cingulata]